MTNSNLRPGRFYSSAQTLRQLSGRRYVKDDVGEYVLDDGDDKPFRGVRVHWNGQSGENCVTVPIPRTFSFPTTVTVKPRPHGRPIVREGDGPTAKWRADARSIWSKLPKNDSAIFNRPARTARPKHAKLAEQLAPLLTWARARDARPLLSTNWLSPDNDNEVDSSISKRPDRASNLGPSPEKLIADAGEVPGRFRHARLGGGGELDTLPLFPAKLGSLRFSVAGYTGKVGDGPYETFAVFRDGGLRYERARVPFGALLDHAERPGELLGPDPDREEQAIGNDFWANLFGIDPATVVVFDDDGRPVEPVFIRAGRKRRRKLLTQAEQLALIADPATPRPPTMHCPRGLPRGTPYVTDNFVGMWRSASKAASGVQRWEGVADELGRRDEFKRWSAGLSADDCEALSVASTAANFADIGKAFGHRGKVAERVGKQRLLAANDNLQRLMAA